MFYYDTKNFVVYSHKNGRYFLKCKIHSFLFEFNSNCIEETIKDPPKCPLCNKKQFKIKFRILLNGRKQTKQP